MVHPIPAVLLLAAVAAPAVLAQGPAEGLRLFGPHLSTDTHLIDTNGAIVHTWSSTFRPGLAVYLEASGLLLRTIDTGVSTRPGAGGGVQRVDLAGNVVWDYRYQGATWLAHHDIVPMANGNVLIVAWEIRTNAEAIAAGRDPALLGTSGLFLPDHIVEVQPTGPTSGDVVWRWNAWDHLVQDFDPTKANFGVVADHPELLDINYPPVVPVADEWNHINAIAHDPVHDWVMVSAPLQDELWIIDHGTTTAEAAGHSGGRWGKGGDLLYRWGNPLTYRAGTAADQTLFFPHSVRFIPAGYPGAGHITVFNNRLPTGSRAEELALPLDPAGNFVLAPGGKYGPTGPVWSFASAAINSPIMSSVERLPNGNTLICSATQRLLLEVTAAGQVVWQQGVSVPDSLPFHAHYVDRSLWSDRATMSIAAGGTVAFDVIAGSQHAGLTYLLIGSASGTSPGLSVLGQSFPINADGYFFALLATPNLPPFANNFGALGPLGRATATFSLPGGALPAAAVGLRLDHDYLAFDPTAVAVTRVGNPVSLVFRP